MLVYRNKNTGEIQYFASTPNWAAGNPDRWDLVDPSLAPAGAAAELTRRTVEQAGTTAGENERKAFRPVFGNEVVSSGRSDPARFSFPSHQEKVLQAFQSGHAWTLSGLTGATMVDDTTDFLLGTQSLKLTTGGAALTHELRSPVLSAIDLSAVNFVMAIKVDDFTHYGDIQLRVSSNGFADYAYCKPAYTSASQRWIEPGQWHIITISGAEAVTGQSWGIGQWAYTGVKGNVNWAAITGLRFKVQDDAAGPITFRTNLIGTFPRASKAVLSLIFDDGRKTHYTVAKPYMDLNRLTGTSAVIADSIGSGNAYMTLNELKALRDGSGWSVIAHAYNNVVGTLAHQSGYDGLTAANGDIDVRGIKGWLGDNGFSGSNLIALPHGSWSINTPGVDNPNPDVLGMMAKYFDVARTTQASTLETWPPAHPYKLRSYTADSSDTAQNWLDVVDQAIAGKNWALMQFHHITSPANAVTETTPTIFRAFIDGIVTRVNAGNLLVRTVQEVLQNGFV